MRKYMFADEAGDFEFSRKPNVSRYFVICTVTMSNCGIAHRLLDLRRELLWARYPVGDYFHATDDKQMVRDRVFELIRQADMRIDATLLEKSKAQHQARESNARFYQYAWYYHLRSIARSVISPETELLITAASLGTKKVKAVFTATVNDVAQQVVRPDRWITCFPPSISDPCLQVADYCTWAIQRKWERADARSYDLIKDKLRREYDLWKNGKTHYY